MNVVITSSEPITATITCDKPNIIEVVGAEPVRVELAVFRDGHDGKSAYQVWLDLGNVGSEADFLLSLKGDDAINNTLEMVRAENPVIEGNIDANGNTIENLRNPIANQEAATKAIVDAALAEAKEYADTISAETVRWAGFWDASAGTYPTGTIRRGDEFEISVAGTIGINEFEVGDLLRARINSPGQTVNNWSASQGNVQQSTESRQGTAKVATAATVGNENSVNDSDFVTAKKLWQNFWSKVLSLAWTWNLRQTFTTAPRLSSTTANQYLKTNGTKDVTSVSAIPAADVTESSTKRFVTDAEKIAWNLKAAKPIYQGYSQITGFVGETVLASFLLPAGTYPAGTAFRITVFASKGITSTNVIYKIYNGVALNSKTNVMNSGLSVSGYNRSKLMFKEFAIENDGANTLDGYADAYPETTSSISKKVFDNTADRYITITVNPANSNEVIGCMYINIQPLN
ncbi:hypothetical protein [Flavobacterium sp.]